MSEKSYRDAIREAMIEEMDRDATVLIMGEDIGVYEGTFRITAGMLKKYGPKRVIDTPIAEAGMAGTAVGMAMLGLRPIVTSPSSPPIKSSTTLQRFATSLAGKSMCRWSFEDRRARECNCQRSTRKHSSRSMDIFPGSQLPRRRRQPTRKDC